MPRSRFEWRYICMCNQVCVARHWCKAKLKTTSAYCAFSRTRQTCMQVHIVRHWSIELNQKSDDSDFHHVLPLETTTNCWFALTLPSGKHKRTPILESLWMNGTIFKTGKYAGFKSTTPLKNQFVWTNVRGRYASRSFHFLK